MSMTKEQEEKAKAQFAKDIEDVDRTDVNYAAEKGKKKIEKMSSKLPGVLKELWEEIKTMVSMLGDYISGDYKDAPWKTIAAIAGTIIYFVSPIDIIPDFIPVIGYLDDAYVVKLCIDFAGGDLNKYRVWKKDQD